MRYPGCNVYITNGKEIHEYHCGEAATRKGDL